MPIIKNVYLKGYGYKLGVYLAVGINKKAGEILTLEWYEDGQRI